MSFNAGAVRPTLVMNLSVLDSFVFVKLFSLMNLFQGEIAPLCNQRQELEIWLQALANHHQSKAV